MFMFAEVFLLESLFIENEVTERGRKRFRRGKERKRGKKRKRRGVDAEERRKKERKVYKLTIESTYMMKVQEQID